MTTQVKWAMVFEGEPSGDLSAYERVVFVSDHEHALAEKDVLIAHKNEKIKKLTAWYDKMFGTPCEEIRHAQQVEDLQAKLAEQARELERLTVERDKYKMEALVKFNCEVCSGSLEDENTRLIKERDDLLRVAVEFAKELRYRPTLIAKKAEEFLATPAATALQQAKEET